MLRALPSLLSKLKPPLSAQPNLQSLARASTSSTTTETILPNKDITRRDHFDDDTVKLATHACCNYHKEGGPIPLAPDADYPDWLWRLNLGHPPALEEMDMTSWQYWRRLRKLGMQRAVRNRTWRFKSQHLHRHYIQGHETEPIDTKYVNT